MILFYLTLVRKIDLKSASDSDSDWDVDWDTGLRKPDSEKEEEKEEDDDEKENEAKERSKRVVQRARLWLEAHMAGELGKSQWCVGCCCACNQETKKCRLFTPLMPCHQKP